MSGIPDFSQPPYSHLLPQLDSVVIGFFDEIKRTGKIPIVLDTDDKFTAVTKSFLIECIRAYAAFGSWDAFIKNCFKDFPELRKCLRKLKLSNSKFLSEVSPKDKMWDVHRQAVDKVASLYDSAGYERYAERLQACSNFLQFEKVVAQQKIKLRAAHFCKVRYCPVCQWRRTLMWTARFLKAMPLIQRDYPKHRYIFITLTVRNCDVLDLREQIISINKAWEKLVRRKIYPGIGYVKSVEITRAYDCYDGNKLLGRHGKTWAFKWEQQNKRKLRLVPTMECHPHLHCLVMVPPGYFSTKGGYLSHDKWVELWQDCLKISYSPVVDVRAVKPNNGSNLVDCLKEVLKYSVKEDDLIETADWLVELTNQLHKVRTISLGGVFKNYLSQDDPEDYIHDGNLDDVEETTGEKFYFDWITDTKRYTSKKSINLKG